MVDWLSNRVEDGRVVRMAKRGPVSHYRLSRDEYAQTVFDLLGVRLDVRMPGVLNEDPRWRGFDRIGSLLSLSPPTSNDISGQQKPSWNGPFLNNLPSW